MSWNKKDKESSDPEFVAESAKPGIESEVGSKRIPTPASLLTPEAQAFLSASISEAVKGVFASMAPLLSSIALTPEKLAEAEALRRAPDPAKIRRELRER